MERITLYHTGFDRIPEPDIAAGRSNADFGPGFYLSPDGDFSRRWTRTRRGQTTWLNTYTLDPEGLNIKRLSRDGEWYDCLYHNRAGLGDALTGYDLVVGPIANDILYDTWGISTSGMLGREQSLRLLLLGPEYRQVAVKSRRAAERLEFIGAEILTPEAIARFREEVRREEETFQADFIRAMEAMLDSDKPTRS